MPSQPVRLTLSNLFCRHPWPLARTGATNHGLSAARPSTLRVCARPVRATCRPRAQEVSRTASCRLRVVFAYAPTAARLRGLPPAACSAHATPPSGLMEGRRGRASVMRHARAAAHTLRVAVRSATVTCLSAHARSIGQRGRQSTRLGYRLGWHRTPPATATLQHQPAAVTHQRPPEAVSGPRQPARDTSTPAQPETSTGP